MQPAHPVLEISGLRIQRGQTTILDGITWRVERGQHWVILGANGSGKTSLLSALNGYFMPTAGQISVLGEQYGQSDWRDLRKQIGLVSSSVRHMMHDDEPALETVITGKYAMIDLWGCPTARDRAEAKRILHRIECSHLAERPWLVLSQGERQRVLIGRALMARPRLMILDEPCAGLDPAAREHFLQFIQRIGRRHDAPTLILITHHVEEIMPIFSHVLILKNGRVLTAGPKAANLNGKLLSEAFGEKINLRRDERRYTITVAAKPRKVI